MGAARHLWAKWAKRWVVCAHGQARAASTSRVAAALSHTPRPATLSPLLPPLCLRRLPRSRPPLWRQLCRRVLRTAWPPGCYQRVLFPTFPSTLPSSERATRGPSGHTSTLHHCHGGLAFLIRTTLAHLAHSACHFFIDGTGHDVVCTACELFIHASEYPYAYAANYLVPHVTRRLNTGDVYASHFRPSSGPDGAEQDW